MEFWPSKERKDLKVVHTYGYESQVEILLVEHVCRNAGSKDSAKEHCNDQGRILGVFSAETIEAKVSLHDFSAILCKGCAIRASICTMRAGACANLIIGRFSLAGHRLGPGFCEQGLCWT